MKRRFVRPVRRVDYVSSSAINETAVDESKWEVLFCDAPWKKRRVYKDGFLVVKGTKRTVIDTEGKSIAQQIVLSNLKSEVSEGNTLEIGRCSVEVGSISQTQAQNECVKEDGNKPNNGTESTDGKIQQVNERTTSEVVRSVPRNRCSLLRKKGESTSKMNDNVTGIPDGCFLLNDDYESKHENPVWIDRFLARKMRKHQLEGVKIMFACLIGRMNEGYNGCILADAMGLGKTLQVIALLWTLFRQSPTKSLSLCRKALIVAPTTLVHVWEQEIYKWLGRDRIGLSILQADKSSAAGIIKGFSAISKPHILVTSYGMIRKFSEEIQNCDNRSGIDLVVSDEGHYVKNEKSKIYFVLKSIGKMHVLISGTPIQNNLTEFFHISNLVCPGILGSFSDFVSKYVRNGERRRKGRKTALEELQFLCKSYIIRRDSSVMQDILPKCTETYIFHELSEVQREEYSKARDSFREDLSCQNRDGSITLNVLSALQSISLHPDLARSSISYEETGLKDSKTSDSESDTLTGKEFAVSAKLFLLEKILVAVKSRSKHDRIVVASSFTSMLDYCEQLLKSLEYSFLRLDGSTSIEKRGDIIRSFNNGIGDIFLISSRAGGCGINLTRSNRLILLEPNWNPSVDNQTVARVWRDGQNKPVYVYRLVAAGTLEELIERRQRRKEELSDCVVDGAEAKSNSDKIHVSMNEDIGTILNFESEFVSHSGCKSDSEQIDLIEEDFVLSRLIREDLVMSVVRFHEKKVDVGSEYFDLPSTNELGVDADTGINSNCSESTHLKEENDKDISSSTNSANFAHALEKAKKETSRIQTSSSCNANLLDFDL